MIMEKREQEDKKIAREVIEKCISPIVEKERGNLPIILKHAYKISAYWLLKEIEIDKKDIIVGKYYNFKPQISIYPSRIEEEVLKSGTKVNMNHIVLAEKMKLIFRSPGGHVVPGYGEFMKVGFDKTIKKIKEEMEKQEREKQFFYEAEMMLAKAAQEYILRHAREAKKMKYRRIEKCCSRIAHDKPSNFYEAVQLFWFLHMFCLEDTGGIVVSIGRLDQFLAPYYENDIKHNRITYQEAYGIILNLWKKIALYDHGFQNIVLGGRNETGQDMCNDLTKMCMEAALTIRAEQPPMILRVNRNTPLTIWEKAFELIKTGIGMPAFLNDEVAIKAKMNAGIDKIHVYDYSVVGCVELTIGGLEYSHTEGLRINWLKVLELMLYGGVCPITNSEWSLKEYHDLEEFSTFDEFYEWYKIELVYVIEEVCKCILILDKEYGKTWPIPFVSLLMNKCLETGKDVTDGGTVYNNLSVNNAGMANVVDSLEVIRRLVFEEKIISLSDVPKILSQNYEGYEEIRIRALKCDKFGNDNKIVDGMLKELVDLTCKTIEQYYCERGGRLQAGFYTVQVHGLMGEKMGASIDGRYRGEALANGLSPVQGRDTSGPTALINSMNNICMDKFGNGMVLDMKFTTSFMEKKSHVEALKNMIQVYFNRGGMEIQFNVVDRETLIAAQREPEKYYNLIVRVSGYSAYFVALDKCLQDEIINRTELSSVQ